MYHPYWNNIILRITPACLFTGIIAASLGQWPTAISEIAVFISSVLHWSNPVYYSYRRSFDLFVVNTSLIIHIYTMWKTFAIAAFIVILLSISSFSWSLYYGSYKHHIIGWILACISNLLLAYSI